MDRMSLLVLTKDAQDCAEANLRRILEYMGGAQFPDWEVLVCDWSRDSTPEIARRLASENPRVRYVPAAAPGIGAGLKAGIDAARFECAMFYSVDMAWEPSVIADSAARLAGGADLVFGSRTAPGSEVDRPALRRAASRGYRILARVALGLEADVNGTMAFRVPLVRSFREFLESDTAFLPTEVYLNARALGASIAEIPCTVRDRRNNSVRLVAKHTRDMLRGMARMRMRGRCRLGSSR